MGGKDFEITTSVVGGYNKKETDAYIQRLCQMVKDAQEEADKEKKQKKELEAKIQEAETCYRALWEQCEQHEEKLVQQEKKIEIQSEEIKQQRKRIQQQEEHLQKQEEDIRQGQDVLNTHKETLHAQQKVIQTFLETAKQKEKGIESYVKKTLSGIRGKINKGGR